MVFIAFQNVADLIQIKAQALPKEAALICDENEQNYDPS